MHSTGSAQVLDFRFWILEILGIRSRGSQLEDCREPKDVARIPGPLHNAIALLDPGSLTPGQGLANRELEEPENPKSAIQNPKLRSGFASR